MREHRGARGVGVLATLGVVAAVLSSCSGGAQDRDGPAPDETAAPPPVTTTVKVARVIGTLPARRRDRVAAGVRDAVDGWIDAAYLGDYPRGEAGAHAFDSFTDGAARQAVREEQLLSNAAVGKRVDGVTAARRLLLLDVLAPDGRPAGVTARVRVVLELTGQVERTDVVSGRLTLTPAEGSWRVFGWDLERVTAS